MKAEVDVDDPLSTSTSRLSICHADIEESEEPHPRLLVREFLNSETQMSRRESAVSLSSFGDDDQQPPQQQQQLPKKIGAGKRRRSSAQSLNITQEPAKREKIHKRKLKKLHHPPTVDIHLDKLKEKGSDGDDTRRFPFKNIRQLILLIFNAGHSKMQWCSLGNPEKIPTICFCLVPGLQLENHNDNGDKSKEGEQVYGGDDKHSKLKQQLPISDLKKVDELPFIYDNFEYFIKSLTPGTKESIHLPLLAITNVPLTKAEKKTLMAELQGKKITIRDLLLSEEQLILHNYPRKLGTGNWKVTQPPTDPKISHIYSLDCEFCKAGAISVLTRISLVNFEGGVVFDEFVKPSEEITDYVTRYSGITEELLEGVETTIDDIQELFLKHVSSEDILVGHSLESDLNVMKIMHSKIVDTAIIYEHNRGPPSKPSLKWLAQEYLATQIQAGENNGSGHSSVEDAQACLDLVKLKIQNGILFGTNVGEISIFKRLAENPKYQGIFKSLWLGYPNPRDPNFDLEELKLTKITNNKNDDEVVDNFLKEIPSKKFAIVNLRDLEYNSNWAINIPDYYNGDLDYDISKAMERTNERLTKIYEALPEWSLMICYSQLGDPKEMFRLQGVKRDFQKMVKDNVDISKISNEESWDTDKHDLLLEKTSLARESLTFMKLKPSKSNGISE